MPTKATLKLVKQLQQKKYRLANKLFIVEGVKSVREFLNSDFRIKFLFATDVIAHEFAQAEICSEKEMQQMTGLKSASPVLAVFEQRKSNLPTEINELCLALDNVQDPGNLGTIIRLADWFGVKHILCNKSTVEVYNPKVIQACMGSLTRVNVHYLDLAHFLQQQENLPKYGTFMDGENLYSATLDNKGIIVMGNEAHGISSEIETLCSHRLTIPQAGSSTESLNVAIAASITMSEFFRRSLN